MAWPRRGPVIRGASLAIQVVPTARRPCAAPTAMRRPETEPLTVLKTRAPAKLCVAVLCGPMRGRPNTQKAWSAGGIGLSRDATKIPQAQGPRVACNTNMAPAEMSGLDARGGDCLRLPRLLTLVDIT